MAFVSPYTMMQVMLLNDRHPLPWITTEKLVYEYPPTGQEFEVPKNFRTNLVSMPKAIMAVPIVGQALFFEFFGEGVWLGARESVLHDWLCTPDENGVFPVDRPTANAIFRYALQEANYPPGVVEKYYAGLQAAYAVTSGA